MARPILLDTCAALWLVDGKLAPDAEEAVTDAWNIGVKVFVSPITAWEVGMLVAKRRLTLTAPVNEWFETLLEYGVEVAEISARLLIASTEITAPGVNDPADRIVAATARAFNYRLMTRDRRLLSFASGGHLSAIAC